MRQAQSPDAVWICADDGDQLPLSADLLREKIKTADSEWFADTYASVLSKIELLGSAFAKQPASVSEQSPIDYITSQIDWAAVQQTCEAIEGLPLDAKESMFASLKTFQVASFD